MTCLFPPAVLCALCASARYICRCDTLYRITKREYHKNQTLIAGYSYDYDGMGNKLYQEDLRRSQDSELYAYDDLYRLTSWERGELNAEKDGIPNPVSDQSWNLDPVGNWDETSYDGVTEVRQHNEVNELIHRDNEITTGLLYCDSGNLIEDHEHEYAYDVFNRLIQVTRKSDSQVIATYRYDTENRRVKRMVENSGNLNGTTHYVYDGWQVVEERIDQDAVIATYTYGNYIDEPITLTAGGNTYYYHTNNLYNVRALTDETGAVVERYRYSAYGKVTILDSNDQEIPASTVGNVYMFQGRRLDAETGLYYYRNRMMSAELGRFLQRDPLGYVDGWNLYEFVNSAPLTNMDPSGLFCIPYTIQRRNRRTISRGEWRYEGDVEFGDRAAKLPQIPGLGGIGTGDFYREVFCVYKRDILVWSELYICKLYCVWEYVGTLLERETEEHRRSIGFYNIRDVEEVIRQCRGHMPRN